MASEPEIQRTRKDKDEWRPLARRLLRFAEHDALKDKDIGFLESIASRAWLEELSYLQAEWLLDIRDGVVVVSEYRGFSLKFLIRGCYENRFGLDDEVDEAWIVEIHDEGRTALRRSDARRVYMLARRLGEIDGDWAT